MSSPRPGIEWHRARRNRFDRTPVMATETGPPTPSSLAAKYAAWSRAVVSEYRPNSVTYRLTGPSDEVRYLKITRSGWTPSAGAEARRLRWARSHAPVPEVLEAGENAEYSWLVTRGLRGHDATHPSLRTDIPRLVTLLARGLRDFHGIPIDACPFQFRVGDALRVARERLAAGSIDASRDFHAEHAHLSPAEAVAQLTKTRPDAENLVTCHGDYCPPNVLVDQGRVVGYVDLGELGVADRWWDLAVASWSIGWNFGPGLEEAFFAAYDIDPDFERIRFYRLLYDVVS